jgi:nitroreductase
MMSVDDAIVGRRSIRSYAARDVADALVHEIVDLARHAPSSMNGQPCHFVVVRDRPTLARLAAVKNRHCPEEKREYPADFLAAAPVAVAVCADVRRSYGREIENGILATALLLIAAASRGLGSVYLSAYQWHDPGLADDVRRLLELPHDVAPITIVPLGFPAQAPAAKGLRPLEEILHDETFGRGLRSRN